MFELEDFLDLGRITPMQTSYTQTAEDRGAAEDNPEETEDPKKTGIEPPADEESEDSTEKSNVENKNPAEDLKDEKATN